MQHLLGIEEAEQPLEVSAGHALQDDWMFICETFTWFPCYRWQLEKVCEHLGVSSKEVPMDPK